jgi:hypothetical protein
VSKQFVLLLCLSLLHSSVLFGKELTGVSLQYFNANALTRIPEYFSGKEYTGKMVYCRTNQEREGLYFSFSLNQYFRKLLTEKNIILSVIRSGRTEIERFTFSLPVIAKGKSEIFLGLTGKDWTSNKVKPIAWQIELKNSNEDLILLKKSFLWSHD